MLLENGFRKQTQEGSNKTHLPGESSGAMETSRAGLLPRPGEGVGFRQASSKGGRTVVATTLPFTLSPPLSGLLGDSQKSPLWPWAHIGCWSKPMILELQGTHLDKERD